MKYLLSITHNGWDCHDCTNTLFIFAGVILTLIVIFFIIYGLISHYKSFDKKD